MAYRLKFDQPVETSVAKIGREQIQRAIKELGAVSSRPGVSAVHETRKCLKRTRALLRLIKPGLPPAQFRKLDHELRDVGRGLAAARDAEILSATIASLENIASGHEDVALEALQDQLESEAAPDGAGPLDPAIAAAAIASLRRIGESLTKLKLEPDGFDCIEAGLALGMKQARRTMAAAFDEGTSEAFHEWRKTVQRHWRHMQLLSRAWPSMFEARVELARQLSQVLGPEHDLTILKAYVDKLPEGTLSAAQLQALEVLISRRQDDLRASARHMGEILLAEKPKPFAHRLATIWRSARQRAEASGGGNGAFPGRRAAGSDVQPEERAAAPATERPDAA